MVGGWIKPLQTLPQVLPLMFDPEPDPELDNFELITDRHIDGQTFGLVELYIYLILFHHILLWWQHTVQKYGAHRYCQL